VSCARQTVAVPRDARKTRAILCMSTLLFLDAESLVRLPRAA
jgi:hypothetical protein